MASRSRERNSTETIYTFENRSMSNWSTVMSTVHVPGMDAAMGGDGQTRRVRGRRKLRISALALGALLTMHCRMTASAISGGFFIFVMFLILAVVALANPLRHFEIYLGQWSISGPGRAFRMIPMFDGIGIAICINAIVRAVTCCTMAALSAVYVLHSVSDARLPFTYCRDFDLKSYEPTWVSTKRFINSQDFHTQFTSAKPITVGLRDDGAWRNISLVSYDVIPVGIPRKIAVCQEVYTGKYPAFYNTPAYNFFYVEVVHLRPNLSLKGFNTAFLTSLIVGWLFIWAVMIQEKVSHGRLIWNNMYSWFVVVPWVWTVVLAVSALFNIPTLQHILLKAFKLETMDVISSIADALQVAMYIHSSSTGTEIILGKGLNHYASGHIDTNLNSENVWFSGLVLLLALLNAVGTATCALSDLVQVTSQEEHILNESAMWILPMYSKCTSSGSYTHLLSALVFAGLTFSYMAVAYTLLKTALHTIFEYRVKLVFIEQLIVALLILICMGLSLLFVFVGGIALLESVDAIMTGIAMPLLCFQEVLVMLWVYRSSDFMSDLNVATEENTCPTRIGTQWHVIPLILLVVIALKIMALIKSDLPHWHIHWSLPPLVAVVLALPLRAAWNAYIFFGRSKRNRQ